MAVPDADTLPLIVYEAEDGPKLDIRPAPRKREWMDATGDAFAYRCLPLVMANQSGWEILADADIEAVWDGRDDPEGIQVTGTGALKAVGHFGHGILTFEFYRIIRTPPGHDLWVQGPVNRFKDGAQALTALIEADWMPFTFTMNWKLTRPGLQVRFRKGEPLCHFFPLVRGTAERCMPTVKPISAEPELQRAYAQAKLRRIGPRIERERQKTETSAEAAERLRFQRWYQRGEMPDGSRIFPEHRKKIVLQPFAGPLPEEDT